MGRIYNINDMAAHTLNNIEPDSVLNLSGMGTVTINGKIGPRTTFNISGMGAVFINADVPQETNFNCSGSGCVTFKNRPPQNVIAQLSCSNTPIVIPGGLTIETNSSKPKRIHTVIGSHSTVPSANTHFENFGMGNVHIGTLIGSVHNSGNCTVTVNNDQTHIQVDINRNIYSTDTLTSDGGIHITAHNPRMTSVSNNNAIDDSDSDSDSDSDLDSELSRVLELSKLDSPAKISHSSSSAASNSKIVGQIGFLAKPATQPAPIDDEEEENDLTCCPITHETMVKPTLCTLDNQTYEYDAIHKWLTNHRSAPFTRAEIPEGKNVKDVLSRNIAVEKIIAAQAKQATLRSAAPSK